MHRTIHRLRNCGFTICVVLAALVGSAPVVQAGQWEIAPYLFAADVSVDISLNESDIGGTTIPFSDLVDKLDIGALVHVEGRWGRGGFFVDITYLSLSDDQTTSGQAPIPDGTLAAAELDQLIGEAGGLFRVVGEEQGLDLLFGARVMDVSLDANLDFPDTSPLADRMRSSDNTLVDGFFGVRYRGNIGKRWMWAVRGDAGAGDTDLTWQGVLTFGLKLGKKRNNTLFLGYRHLEYEFDEGSNGITGQDVGFSGATTGFSFGF